MKFLILMVISLTVIPSAIASFDIDPITATLAPSGKEASTTFTVKSGSDKKIPIQITIVSRDPNEKGEEKHIESKEVEDLFQIYPSQLVLNPKEKRSVRVSWIGKSDIKKELAFRILAEELPFDVDSPKQSFLKPQGSVKFAMKYVGSIYITPERVTSKIVVSAEPTKEANPKLSIKIENQGTAHELLEKMNIILTSLADKTKPPYTIPEKTAAPIIKQNILAGKTRVFTLPWPAEIPLGPVQIKFESMEKVTKK